MYDAQSKAAIDFATCVKSRILGNDDDQRICYDQPSRAYDFGILFSRTDAEANRKGDRSIFKPNALTVRFEIPSKCLSDDLKLDIRPSFWLYFRRAPGENPPLEWGDCFDRKRIWKSWQECTEEIEGAYNPREWLDQQKNDSGNDNDEKVRPFIRKRYSRSYAGSLSVLKRVELDLDTFCDAWRWLGEGWKYPWAGYIEVSHRDGSEDDRCLIEVRLVNDRRYNPRGGLRGEPAWFDVRLGVKINSRVLPVYCPLLDKDYQGLQVQTVNCVLDKQSYFDDKQSVIVVEQVGEVIRHRRTMKPASAFARTATNPNFLLDDVCRAADAAEAKDPDHATALRQACKHIQKNPNAMKALQVVTETFARSIPILSNKPPPTWHLHQSVTLVLAINNYMQGGDTLLPLIINVPTAGGKTEAFTAAAFWTVAYEAFCSGRMGTAIIKYPTTMLSDDQASRLARYVMHFDAVMAKHLSDYKPRGLGLFFGKDNKSATPQQLSQEIQQRVGKTCPICGKTWDTVHRLSGESGWCLVCPKKHRLHISIHDEVFYMRPALIVSTLHKFVAKTKKGLMRTLLGGQGYWCQRKRQVTNKEYCWSDKERRKLDSHVQARERTLITTLVLDEAHLIREDTGALAAHFETHYLELARNLGGRYPLVVVATATIAHVEHHTQQLGLGRQPTIFPGKDGRNEQVYYEPTGQVHHVILACMPRGRAIAWALPHLVEDYIDVVEEDEGNFNPFIPTMVYCPSYLTRDQMREGIHRQINERRRGKGKGGLEVDEFSRQRFNQEGQDAVLKRIQSEKVHVVLSTNIASVGIDLPNLNSILYFGVPVSISEFIQSLNRVARKEGQPGVALLVLDPYKERDNSYYAYLEPFAKFPHRIVEAVPLNRYARKAIDETFDTIAMAQISHWWSQQVKGVNIFQPAGFRAARGTQLSDTMVVPLLSRIYRADGDLSEEYPKRVQALWSALANNLGRFTGRSIWKAPNLKNCWNLIPPQPEGTLVLSPEAQSLKQASIRAVYGLDRSEVSDPQDEEFGLVDGANEDTEVSGTDG